MPRVEFTRRQFLKGLAAAALAGAAGAGAYGWLWESFDYEVTETAVPVRGLPAGFEGFRVAQLSDVHHSAMVPVEEVRRVVELANAARPDLIVLTGDYTTKRADFIEPCAEALGGLRAPGGVWAVLGNHDHYTDPKLTARALKSHGIEVLGNANTELLRGGDSLRLAGVDDLGWGKADLGRALRGVGPGQASVLLSHEPLVFDRPKARGVSLVLSGHTHGGQVCLPVVGAPARLFAPLKYLRGLYEREGSRLYVSRGTGMVGLPVRIGARPEVAVLRLQRDGA